MYEWMSGSVHLREDDCNDGLGVDEGGVAQIVKAAGGKDLGAGLPPDGLAKADAVLGQQLWCHAAECSEHGPASVDHLNLTVPVIGKNTPLDTGRMPLSTISQTTHSVLCMQHQVIYVLLQ